MKFRTILSCLSILRPRQLHAVVTSNGAYTPEKILPKGIDETISVNPYTGESGNVRKGTVAATVNNVALLNKLLLEQDQTNDQKIQDLINAVMPLIPSLRVIGMFDFFNLHEWLQDYKSQPGRALIAVLYLEKYPEYQSQIIAKDLKDIERETQIVQLKKAIMSVEKKT